MFALYAPVFQYEYWSMGFTSPMFEVGLICGVCYAFKSAQR